MAKGKFVSRVKGEVKNSKGAYVVAKGRERQKLKRVHMFLRPDLVEYLDDFVYSMKKSGMSVSVSEVMRTALYHYRSLPRNEQIDLLDDRRD